MQCNPGNACIADIFRVTASLIHEWNHSAINAFKTLLMRKGFQTMQSTDAALSFSKITIHLWSARISLRRTGTCLLVIALSWLFSPFRRIHLLPQILTWLGAWHWRKTGGKAREKGGEKPLGTISRSKCSR